MNLSPLSPKHRRALVGLALTAVVAFGLQYGSAVLAWASGDPLDFVGHLISGLHLPSLDSLDPTYPRCF